MTINVATSIIECVTESVTTLKFNTLYIEYPILGQPKCNMLKQ